MKTLILAEKGQQAKPYLAALGGTPHKRGMVTITQSTNPQIGEAHLICASGHLIGLKMPDDYDEKYKTWNYADLPFHPQQFKYGVINAKADGIMKTINQELLKVNQIVIATDPDREGEYIARLILKNCTNVQQVRDDCTVLKNSHLLTMQRIELNSMTKAGAQQAFRNMHSAKDHARWFDEAQARSEADWEVGMNGSRMLCLKLSQAGYGKAWGFGRCQSAYVSAVVENDQRINNFHPEKYYRLQFVDTAHQITFTEKFTSDSDSTTDNKETRAKPKGHYDLNEAQQLHQSILNQPVLVAKVDHKRQIGRPPKLFNLRTLSMEASRHWHYSADQVMKIVESLYLNGYMTYPRTKREDITEYELQYLSRNKQQLANLLNITDHLADENAQKRKSLFVSTKPLEHTALVPGDKLPQLGNLTEEQLNIYRLVTLRTLAYFADDYIYEKTEVLLQQGQVQFTANGIQVIDEGFYHLLGRQVKQIELPDYQEGQRLVGENKLTDYETKPETRLNESNIFAGVLKNIGTVATQAVILDTILHKNYVKKDRQGNFYPTVRGQVLYQALQDTMFTNLKTTEIWENFLTKIGEGQQPADKFVNSIRKALDQYIGQYATQLPTITVDAKTFWQEFNQQTNKKYFKQSKAKKRSSKYGSK